MANAQLREALARANMTEAALAGAVGCDEKTVQRWVSDAARLPHPRHRYAAAKALGVEESDVWPEVMRNNLKTGHDREVVTVYPYRSAVPGSLWRELIGGADKKIVFAGYTNYFLWIDLSNLQRVLKRKLDNGVEVGFLVGDPDSEVTRRREEIEKVPLSVSTRIAVSVDALNRLRSEAPNVQARLSDRHIALSVFQFDDNMIVNVHIADLLGHDSPTLHLRRHGDDGLFDRFAGHVEHLWKDARDVWA